MNKSINVKTEEFKKNLYSLINNSELPISNVFLIFQLAFRELENLYYTTLNEETPEQTIKEDIDLSNIGQVENNEQKEDD